MMRYWFTRSGHLYMAHPRGVVRVAYGRPARVTALAARLNGRGRARWDGARRGAWALAAALVTARLGSPGW